MRFYLLLTTTEGELLDRYTIVTTQQGLDQDEYALCIDDIPEDIQHEIKKYITLTKGAG